MRSEQAGQAARTQVLVVIPTLNEARTIESVLAQLSTGLPTDADVFFVVCDGGSSDGTQALVTHLMEERDDLTLLHNPHRLQSAAVNLAVSRYGAGAQVLVRCDAHAKYPRGFIASLVASLKSNGADSVVVPMDTVGDTCLRKAIAWVSDSPVGSGGSAHRGGRRSGFVDHGHHAAFRMESFVKVGGYDETFSHNEDAELDCRQAAVGSRVYLDSAIRLDYLPRGTWTGFARQYFNYGRGRSRTVRRHPGSLRLRQLAVPVHIGLCALAMLLAPLSVWLLLWPLAYVLALAAVSVHLAYKHRSPCGLLGGAVAGVMHTAWAAGFLVGFLTLRELRWTPQDIWPLEPDPIEAESEEGAR